jgi:hypothetical protein
LSPGETAGRIVALVTAPRRSRVSARVARDAGGAMRAVRGTTAISLLVLASIAAADADAQSAQTNSQAQAGAGAAEKSVAAKLQNPIANLMSFPFQNNFEVGAGSSHAFGYTLNFQPVIPFPLGPRLKILSRTIFPAIIDQPEIEPGTGREVGIGDVTQSLFFSPADETAFIWGIGPVLLLPTATNERLGSGKWGAGPTLVALVQAHGWTAGALLNHIWSFAGDDARRPVSSSFMQPFASYTWEFGFSVTAQTETTYDWEAKQWDIPVALGVSQVVRFGALPVSFGLFGRYWADGDDAAPKWAIRVPITFVLPSLASKPQTPDPPPRVPPVSRSLPSEKEGK